jgi:hypothetical protein
MKKLIVFVLLAHAALAVSINEVMYNPIGDDNNREYIEVLLDHPQSLENWTIADSGSNDTLVPLRLTGSLYALIVEEGFNVTRDDVSYYSAGPTIGNNLNNGQEAITLYDKSRTVVDSMQYDGTLGNSNDHSIEFCGSWVESAVIGGTPGWQNSACIPEEVPINETNGSEEPGDGGIVNETTEPSDNSTEPSNQTYPEDGQDPIPDTDPDNSTTEGQMNETDGVTNDTQSPCSQDISISLGKQIVNIGESVVYTVQLSDETQPFSLEYWIEDLSGHEAKSPYTTTNCNERSWTPKSGGVYLIKARLMETACESSVNYTEAILVVNDTVSEPEPESDLEIISAQESGTFGKPLAVELSVYRGDTEKYSIELYLEDSYGKRVSETMKLQALEKYTSYDLVVPISTSQGDFANSTYTIVVEGLGLEDSSVVDMQSIKESCKTCPVCKVCPACKTCPACKECKQLLNCLKQKHIKSFYTLVKKYGEKINLYASLEDAENKSVVLLSSVERIEQPVNSSKLAFPVGANPGENHYMLAVMDNDTIVDAKELTVEFDEPEEQDSSLEDITSYAVDEAVYESPGSKAVGYVSFAIVGVLAVCAGIYVKHRYFTQSG